MTSTCPSRSRSAAFTPSHQYSVVRVSFANETSRGGAARAEVVTTATSGARKGNAIFIGGVGVQHDARIRAKVHVQRAQGRSSARSAARRAVRSQTRDRSDVAWRMRVND